MARGYGFPSYSGLSSPLFFALRPTASTHPPASSARFRLVARARYEIRITKCTGDGAPSPPPSPPVTGRRKLLMRDTRTTEILHPFLLPCRRVTSFLLTSPAMRRCTVPRTSSAGGREGRGGLEFLVPRICISERRKDGKCPRRKCVAFNDDPRRSD